MTVTMDTAGRVVLPKAIRERAQLTPGAPLDVRVVDGRVELTPACAKVTINKKGVLWVASPVDQLPALKQEQVDATIDVVRSRTPGSDDE
jgi:AbrB family looped-hinge helix DNA binding protein